MKLIALLLKPVNEQDLNLVKESGADHVPELRIYFLQKGIVGACGNGTVLGTLRGMELIVSDMIET